MEDFTQMFTFLSIGFGLTLSTKLFFIKSSRPIVLWLGLYVLLLVGVLTEIFLPEESDIFLIIGATYWLFGPALYLYCKHRIEQKENPFFQNSIWHITPFIVYTVLTIVFKFGVVVAENELVDFILYEIVFIHILSYFFTSLKFINRFKSNRPGKEPRLLMQMSSMTVLIVLSLLIFGGSWIFTHITVLTGLEMTSAYRLFVQASITLLIFAIALLNTETMYTERIVK